MPVRPPRRRYVSVHDAADHLGMSDRTIKQMGERWPPKRIPQRRKLVRLDLNEIDARTEAYGGDV